MLLFQYSAANEKGRVMHGELRAADKSDLVSQLQFQGLFLISCHSQEVTADIPQAQTLNGSMPERLSDARRNGPNELSWDQLTKRQRFYFIALLCLGVAVGCWRTYERRHPTPVVTILQEKMDRFEALQDKSRGRIESIFSKRYPRADKPGMTAYFVPPHFVVGLTYDAQGGVGSAQNRFMTGSKIQISRTTDPGLGSGR